MKDMPEKQGSQSSFSTKDTSDDWSRHTEISNEKIPPLLKKISQGLTTSDFNDIVQEINKNSSAHHFLNKDKQKSEFYSEFLSYEGSIIFCVLLSINKGKNININGIPKNDRDIILSRLPFEASIKLLKQEEFLNIEFDENKDFIITYYKDETPIKLNFLNTIIHSSGDLNKNIFIEEKDKNSIIFNQKITGINTSEVVNKEEELIRRYPVVNRNAYEIRSDILQMAINWIEKQGNLGKKDEVDILNLAKKFYEFVEGNRRK
ncbi:MAG TPA: hypothetical protein PL028_03090 [Bacteroidales bacterium]|jgi:hypothetical protein|nr:hypothetical protein [bacterium]HOT88512.1 hypothetical protein [Bacteroidales bacterium]